jgi:hypothetical protein
VKANHREAFIKLRELCREYGMFIRPETDDGGLMFIFEDGDPEEGFGSGGGHWYTSADGNFGHDSQYLHEEVWDLAWLDKK